MPELWNIEILRQKKNVNSSGQLNCVFTNESTTQNTIGHIHSLTVYPLSFKLNYRTTILGLTIQISHILSSVYLRSASNAYYNSCSLFRHGVCRFGSTVCVVMTAQSRLQTHLHLQNTCNSWKNKVIKDVDCDTKCLNSVQYSNCESCTGIVSRL